MTSEAAIPTGTPNRSDVIPDTYAIHVDDDRISVWQFRVDIAEPDGQWYVDETLDRDDDPKLSLEYATPMAPTTGGYWIYCRSYECELGCE